MKSFIIKAKVVNLFFVLFWIIIWYILSLIIGEDIILASPISVFKRVYTLVIEPDFFITIFNSVIKVFMGFILGGFIGVILAILCKKNYILYKLFSPIITFIKVTPIACFIILILFWIDSDKLSILISFFMSLPIFFFNIYSGISVVDDNILQMCKIYNIGGFKRLKYIYFPSLVNIILSTCILGFSMSWKAGIASEIIGITNFSIGGKLQSAKSLLETTDVLAWTIIIIFINLVIENIIKYIINKINIKLIGEYDDKN